RTGLWPAGRPAGHSRMRRDACHQRSRRVTRSAEVHDRHSLRSLDASTGNGLHTLCDRAPCSIFLFTPVPRDVTSSRGRSAVDPVIIVGAGPVGLTPALALARQEAPWVVPAEAPGEDEPRPARNVGVGE